MRFYKASSAIFVMAVVITAYLPTIQGQMSYYNTLYDAQVASCQSGAYGSARECGYGTGGQNWFGTYQLGKANPYGFVSTMPYGYGSGAQPFFSDPYSGGWPGTSYAPGGYIASALPPISNNYYPNQNSNNYYPNQNSNNYYPNRNNNNYPSLNHGF